jgi:hypothetical protein
VRGGKPDEVHKVVELARKHGFDAPAQNIEAGMRVCGVGTRGGPADGCGGGSC